METPPEYHKSFRGRANTLERTEQIRPPRRKRRSQDSGSRRAGSVPPEPSSSSSTSSSFSGRSVDHEATPTTIVVNPVVGITGSSTINHLLPLHFPRVRRASRQNKQSSGYQTGSAPSSGTNTPDTIHGSSAVDLYDLTPFGSLESSGTGSGVIGVSSKSNTLRAARHKNRTSAPGSTKWNWIWNRTSSSGGSGKNSPDLKPDIKHGSGGSFLGRKRKSRHISCPDISSASDSASDMSRSTSPVGFKVSLSSLFGGHRGHGTVVTDVAAGGAATAASTSSARSSQHAGSSASTRRSLGISKAEKISSSQKATHLTYAKPVMSQVDDFTSEIIDELCSVQYCHISDPLRGLNVETLNPQEIESRYIKY